MSLTDSDLDAIADRMADRVVAKLRALPAEPKPETTDSKGAMRILGVRSRQALSRRCIALGVRRVARDCYRTADLVNAIARATLPMKGGRR